MYLKTGWQPRQFCSMHKQDSNLYFLKLYMRVLCQKYMLLSADKSLAQQPCQLARVTKGNILM